LKADFDAAPTVIDSDDLEKQATDLGGRLAKFLKLTEAQRTIDKAPTLQASRIVDNFYSGLKDTVAPCMAQTERRVNAYKDEKARIARLAREEAERRQREAAAEAERLAREAQRLKDEEAGKLERQAANQAAVDAAKEAKAAAKEVRAAPVSVQTKGESGTSSIQTKRWTGEITDLESLDLEALRPYISTAELEKAVRAYALKHQDTKPLAGAKIYEKSSTSFRA
jgi:hypothetical protein